MTDDIVYRLRKWTVSVNAVPCGDLMDEAADEIERMRLEATIRDETRACPPGGRDPVQQSVLDALDLAQSLLFDISVSVNANGIGKKRDLIACVRAATFCSDDARKTLHAAADALWRERLRQRQIAATCRPNGETATDQTAAPAPAESLGATEVADVGGAGACPYVVGRTTQYCSLTPFTLTDEEREAIKQAIHIVDWQQAYFSHAGLGQPLPSATLRSLLERTK
jgi:hypothetical protein